MTQPVPRRTKIYAVLMLVAAAAFAIGASVRYTNDTRHKMNQERIQSETAIDDARIKSDREWCVIIRVFVETYRRTPPLTETGKVLEREFERLYASRHCSDPVPGERPPPDPSTPVSPLPSATR